MTKLTNEEAWEKLFSHFSIVEAVKKSGFFDISAEMIKAVTSKEPRLMTKIDFKEHLPSVMKKAGLSILAIKNGLYRIARSDPFILIKETPQTEIKEIRFHAPESLASLITSESAALDTAYISGMLDDVFGEKSFLTLRGRLRGNCRFTLGERVYDVEGVQVEIDGGYEGERGLYLIEAKIGSRNNISLRQLLYPELMWKQRINKNVQSFLFLLQDDLFRFIPFIYDQSGFSLDQKKEKVFRIRQERVSFELLHISPKEGLIDLKAPFPQADKFEKVNALLTLLLLDSYSKEEIYAHFDMTYRQVNYYVGALVWLRYASVKKGEVFLTAEGEGLSKFTFAKRMEYTARKIFSHLLFHKALHEGEESLSEEDFLLYGFSKETIKRRRQTIRRWVLYFQNYFKEHTCIQKPLF